MGLIKTAMYAGAGMYAVNKISKEIGKRDTRENPHYQQQGYQQMEFQNSNRNPSPTREQPKNASYADQEPVYLNNTYVQAPEYAGQYQYRDEQTPQYYRAPIQQRGFIEPEEYGSGSDHRSDRMGQFTQLASGFMGSKGRDGKKDKSNMFADLLQK